jgi:hypothetical protein
MSTAIIAVLTFLVSWFVLWAALMVVYLGYLAIIDYLKARWRRYQCFRLYKRAIAAEMARIDLAANASVHRLGTAFMVAQQLMRDQSRER